MKELLISPLIDNDHQQRSAEDNPRLWPVWRKLLWPARLPGLWLLQCHHHQQKISHFSSVVSILADSLGICHYHTGFQRLKHNHLFTSLGTPDRAAALAARAAPTYSDPSFLPSATKAAIAFRPRANPTLTNFPLIAFAYDSISAGSTRAPPWTGSTWMRTRQ